MEAAKLNQLKEEINKYSYDEATHKLFAIKGDIVDYKLNIANKESHLKGLKSGKDVKQIARIKDLKIKVEKLKTTYVALKTNEELTALERVIKRKSVKKELIEAKKELHLANKFKNEALEKEYLEAVNSYNKLSNSEKSSQKSAHLTKLADINKINETNDNLVEIEKLEAEIKDEKTKLKEYLKINRKLMHLLSRQRIKTNRYNNLAEEKKEILKLDKVKDAATIKTLEKQYKDKQGKILKYQSNSFSYWLMLLAVLIEIIYVIVFLNKMYVSYLEFPTLIINLIFILFLFLSAMKVKVYSKSWTIINFVFGCYLFVRIFAVIPFVASDRPASYDEAGELISEATSYQDLRVWLYSFTIIMIVLIFISNIRSTLKIKERDLHLN